VKYVPTEFEEQVLTVQYAEERGCKLTAIPNSTYTKSWNQKRRNKASGLRAGFPDLVIIANSKFFCIEMKRTVDSTTSKTQKEWHAALTAAGISVHICKGFDQAKEVIDNYLMS
jgi:hypothetical protein